MKRALGRGRLGLLLILLSPPLLAAIALVILIDSGRPILFRQRRAGKDGVPFTMLKFRTMVTDAEERLGESRLDLKAARPAGLQDPSTTRG